MAHVRAAVRAIQVHQVLNRFMVLRHNYQIESQDYASTLPCVCAGDTRYRASRVSDSCPTNFQVNQTFILELSAISENVSADKVEVVQ